MTKLRDPAWLDEVRQPGPNGKTFHHLVVGDVLAATASSIMEDDIDTSKFTPGCAAYAGYTTGSFANMAAVRAYAASQGARSFSYSTSGDPNADAIDMEPGGASAADFPGFYHAKGGKNVYGYGSASWTSQINSAAAAAGITRSSYKIVSAHYIGPHICGPSTCGHPQADATQFTDAYLGLSLDATLLGAGFFVPVPPPNPFPDLRQGDTGQAVITLQKRLNAWGASPVLSTDGSFGTKTEIAVAAFQKAQGLPHDGIIQADDWAVLNRAPKPPLPSGKYGPPLALHSSIVSRHVEVQLSWTQPALLAGQLPASEFIVYVYKGTSPSAATTVPGFPVPVPIAHLTVDVPAGHTYTAHVVAAGLNGANVAPGVFAAVTFTV